jgi:hypothetical protein
MLLYSQETEIRCIKTLTNSKIPEAVRSTLLGKLDKSHFRFPPCSASFNRISVIAKKRTELIDYDDLLEDPALEEDFRDVLRDSDVKSCGNKKSLKLLFERLNEYRKIRIIYETSNDAIDALDSGNVDVEQLLNKITAQIVSANSDTYADEKVISFGQNDNSYEIVDEVLNSVAEVLLKTGFTEFDNKAGGLPKEGVMIIAATTSGGKSAVLMNLLINIYRLCKMKVLRLSLEMGDRQETTRLLSNLSGVPLWKFKHNKLTMVDKKRIKKAHAEFIKFGQENDCSYCSWSPKRPMKFDEAMRWIKPFQFDIVGVDYISLFEGVDVDNQWMMLSGIARQAKVYSRNNSCLVILLCQLDDDTDKLRYSRGVKEHCDVMWRWNYSKEEQRELRILPVKQDKCRDGELFPFELGERFDIMRVENVSSEESDDYEGSEEDELGNNVIHINKSSSALKTDEDDGESDHAYALE